VAAHLAVDAADVKSAIAERISVILQNMTSLMTSFVVGFIIEWRVAILILATFPLLVLANFAQVISGLLLSVILRLNLPFKSIFKETRLANLIACQKSGQLLVLYTGCVEHMY
jgi:ABC-type multidrug transport system fused ATPase/permease subunit